MGQVVGLSGPCAKETFEVTRHLRASRDSLVEGIVDQIGDLDTRILDGTCCLLHIRYYQSGLDIGSIGSDS